MAQFVLEESRRRHPSNRSLEVVPDESTFDVTRSSFDAIRLELDDYYLDMRGYVQMDPDEVMLSLSSIAARLTEIRAHLVRDGGQRANALRTKEIDPLLEQVDLQFKLFSRIQAIRQMDWEMTRGQ